MQLRTLFYGPDGLRAGWRALLFALCSIALGVGLRFAVAHLPIAASARRDAKSGFLSPGPSMIWEGIQFLFLAGVTGLFIRVEGRTWSEYRLPWSQTLGRSFWRGVAWGFVALSLLLFLIYLSHGFTINGVSETGLSAIRFGLEWAIVFLVVGAFEELLFRGYLLQVLARSIGFWPAAAILSALFGIVHLQNAHEAWLGILQTMFGGLFFCFLIWRTGTLWFAIGLHAAWDYAQSFVYGVPDSGLMAKGHLLNSSLHGPWWITGGEVGPEGSLFCTAVVAIMFALGWRFLPRAQGRSSLVVPGSGLRNDQLQRDEMTRK